MSTEAPQTTTGRPRKVHFLYGDESHTPLARVM